MATLAQKHKSTVEECIVSLISRAENSRGLKKDDLEARIVKGLEKGKPEIAVGVGLEMIVLKLKRFFPNLVFKIMNGQYNKIAASNQIES